MIILTHQTRKKRQKQKTTDFLSAFHIEVFPPKILYLGVIPTKPEKIDITYKETYICSGQTDSIAGVQIVQ